MLSRGAKPKLPQIRALEGNRSKRPIPAMPELPRATEAPPAELTDAVALAYWDEHWPALLTANIVTAVDRRMFQRCCELYAISADESVTRSRRHTAHREWVRLAGLFGLSPLDRVRLAKTPLKDSPGTKWSSAL